MENVSSRCGKSDNAPRLRFPEFRGEWLSTTLGAIGTFTKGAPLSKADIASEGTPFILYGELYTTYKEVTTEIKRRTLKTANDECMSRVGDVIIPTSGETPDEIATATCIMVSNVILAGDLNIYRNSTIDGRFISYIINHVINGDISRIAQGKSVVHIKASELAKLRINYPSRQEQNKIIDFLMLLNRKIAKQQSLINALKTYKRGVFSVLLNSFSKYETLLLENCASIKKGEQLNKTDMIKNGKYYVLNGGVAASGRTDNFNTDKNTISISEGGNSCGFVLFNTEKFWSGGHCYTLQNLKQNINNQYLFHYLKFHEKQIMSLRVGSGLPNIQKSELEKFEVLLPSADIQNKIANIMSNITAYEDAVKKELLNLDKLKLALLQKMFI